MSRLKDKILDEPREEDYEEIRTLAFRELTEEEYRRLYGEDAIPPLYSSIDSPVPKKKSKEEEELPF